MTMTIIVVNIFFPFLFLKYFIKKKMYEMLEEMLHEEMLPS